MDGYDLAVNILFTRFRINKDSINYLCKSRYSLKYCASIMMSKEVKKVNYFIDHINLEEHRILPEKDFIAKNLIK